MSLKDPVKRKAYYRKYHLDNREKLLAQRKSWYHANKHLQKDDRKWAHTKNRYGIDQRDYETMWKRQGGACPVCGNMELDGKKLHIDHDHATGRVRGLLCGPCNRFIGLAKENIHTLHGAVDYLERQRGFPCHR